LQRSPLFRAWTIGSIVVAFGCSGARRVDVSPVSVESVGSSGYTLDPCGPGRGRERIAGEEAIIGWRAAITRDAAKDREMVVVVAGGGDLSPQRVVAYGQCKGRLKCTGGADQPKKFKGVFDPDPRWSSLDHLFASQVQFARLAPAGEPLVLVSSYYGTARYPRSGACGAGVQYYTPTADDYSCAHERRERLTPVRLLKDVSVLDFVAEDLDGDKRIDLVVASKGVARPNECQNPATDGDEGDPPPGHWGLVFERSDALPVEFEPFPGETDASLHHPFVGIYLNKGDGEPLFGAEPDAWFQVRSEAGSISEPSRVITLDLNRDGWQDIAVAVNGQFTAMWLSEAGVFQSPEHRRLSKQSCAGQFWCVENGGKMTADMVGVVLDDRTLLLETRGYYPGHSAKRTGTGGGVYASQHKGASRALFEDETGLPTFVATARSGDTREISFGWTRGTADRLEPEVKVMPLRLDGRRVPPVVVAKDVLALRSSGFDLESRGRVTWRASPAKGPYVAVPSPAWHDVESVTYDDVTVERCRPGVAECWDHPGGAWSATPAILAYGSAGRVVQVKYAPVNSHNQLLPSALPLLNAFSLGGATVLWRERPPRDAGD
jgi:hypothetical protein